MRVDVFHHFDLVHDSGRHLLREILNKLKELKIMSESNSAQVAAAFAEINTTLDSIGTDVTNIAADVDGLLAGMTPGDPVTADMVSAATAIRDRVAAIKGSLDAVDAKVPAEPAP